MNKLLICLLSIILVATTNAFPVAKGGSSSGGRSFSKPSSPSKSTSPSIKPGISSNNFIPMIVIFMLLSQHSSAAEMSKSAEEAGVLFIHSSYKNITEEQCDALTEDDEYIASYSEDTKWCHIFYRR